MLAKSFKTKSGASVFSLLALLLIFAMLVGILASCVRGGTSETTSDKATSDTSATTLPTSDDTHDTDGDDTQSTTPVSTAEVTPPPTVSTGTTAPTTPPETGGVTTDRPDEGVPEPPNGTSIVITYASSSAVGGYIAGAKSQTIKYGQTKTTLVQAEPSEGYKFVRWSDGSTNQNRVGDSFKKNVTITAIFEIEYLELPVVNIDMTKANEGYKIGLTQNELDSDQSKHGVNYETNNPDGSITFSLSNTSAQYTINDMPMWIHGRGHGSWGEPKKSYRIKLASNVNMLGVCQGKDKDYCLLAYNNDYTQLRGSFSFELARGLTGMAWNTSISLIDLYINGEYRGVYMIAEAVQVDNNKVNIDTTGFETSTDIGYLFEIKQNDYNHFSVGSGRESRPYQLNSELSSNASVYNQQVNYIKNYVAECWAAVKSGNRTTIESLMDINSVIDSYLVEEIAKNLDVGYSSFCMYKDKGGKLFFGPVWDLDFAGGNSDSGGCMDATGLYVGDAAQGAANYQSSPWFYTLMTYKWFRELVRARWNQTETNAFIKSMPGYVTQASKNYKNSLKRNFEKWGGSSNNRINYKIKQALDSGSGWQGQVSYLTNWLTDHIEWLDNYINSAKFLTDATGTSSPDPVNPLTSLSGTGSKTDPYLIKNAADWVNLTDAIKLGSNLSGKYVKQTANINVSDVYNGISGGDSMIFSGIYDGNGYTLTVDIEGGDQCPFGYVNGVIMNLITAGTVDNTAQAAGIVRSLRDGGAVINCASTVNVISPGGNKAGLVATYSGTTYILNSYFAGTITGGTSKAAIVSNANGVNVSGCLYLDGLTNAYTGATALAAASLRTSASTLNNSRSASLALISGKGITIAELCTWSNGTGNGYPTLSHK